MFESIVKNIIPHNIKDIKIIKDTIDIFLEHLVQNSEIAIDIYNMFDRDKEPLFEEYVKIYLKNMYLVLTNSNYNEQLEDKLKKLYQLAGIKNFKELRLEDNILDILNEDVIFSNKAYKNSKGIANTIEFTYNMMEKLELQQSVLRGDGYFNLIEGPEIFKYTVEGSLLEEIFAHYVKPLAHPVGWAYTYNRLYTMYFRDYFLVEPEFVFKEFYIGCQWGNSDRKDDFIKNIGYLAWSDDNDNNIKIKDGVLIYPDYKGEYPEKNLDDILFVANGKDVKNVVRHGVHYDVLPGSMNLLVENTTVKEILQYSSGKDIITEVYFKTGEKIESHTYPRSLKLLYHDNKNTPKNSKGKYAYVKKDYDDHLGHCGLVLDYTYKLKSTIKDPIKFAEDFGFASTVGKLNAVGNIFCGKFRVGDRYVNSDVSVTYKSYATFNHERYHDNLTNLKNKAITRVLFYDNKLEVFFNSFYYKENDIIKIQYDNTELQAVIEQTKHTFNIGFKNKNNIKFQVLRNQNIIDEFYIKTVKPNVKTKYSETLDNTYTVVPDYRTGIWVYNNPGYFNNTVNDFSLNDYSVSRNYIKLQTPDSENNNYLYKNNKFIMQENLIGNAGLFAVDKFNFEIILKPIEVELIFKDNVIIRDHVDLDNQREYVDAWYVYGGYVSEYHEQTLSDKVIHQRYGAFKDYDDAFYIRPKG